MDKMCKDEIKINLEGVKRDFESLHGQSKTGVINMNSSDNIVRALQTQLNDYAGKMERGSKQCVDTYNNQYNTAVDEYKSAQEKYDKAKKTYDDAEAAKVLASKRSPFMATKKEFGSIFRVSIEILLHFKNKS
jgi:hypothetical protein